jgi:NTP pyrophosphatase (non-canonical NTP hydrolase)
MALSFEDLAKANATRAERWHGPDSTPWRISDWVLAMVGEAGEAANVAKKLLRHETSTANTGDPSPSDLLHELGHEIADVVIYADLVAQAIGVDLADLVRRKFDIVSVRHGFPDRLT